MRPNAGGESRSNQTIQMFRIYCHYKGPGVLFTGVNSTQLDFKDRVLFIGMAEFVDIFNAPLQTRFP